MTINIPTGSQKRVEDAFASVYGYKAEIANPDHDPDDSDSSAMIDNPQSISDFFKDQVVHFITSTVLREEAENARKSAIEAHNTSVAQLNVT